MKLNSLGLATFLLFVGAVPSAAQEVPKFEVLGGYAYIRADVSDERVNLNGWTIVLKRNLNPVVALLVDFDGVYGSQHDEDIRLVFHPVWSEVYGSKGEVSAVCSTVFGVVREAEGEDVHYGFGTTLGGGLDVDLNRRLSLRLAQADYEYTRVNVLNHHNFRFVTGVILKFGVLN
jgi:hypothetical protein